MWLGIVEFLNLTFAKSLPEILWGKACTLPPSLSKVRRGWKRVFGRATSGEGLWKLQELVICGAGFAGGVYFGGGAPPPLKEALGLGNSS